jgi:hypothetical protein
MATDTSIAFAIIAVFSLTVCTLALWKGITNPHLRAEVATWLSRFRRRHRRLSAEHTTGTWIGLPVNRRGVRRFSAQVSLGMPNYASEGRWSVPDTRAPRPEAPTLNAPLTLGTPATVTEEGGRSETVEILMAVEQSGREGFADAVNVDIRSIAYVSPVHGVLESLASALSTFDQIARDYRIDVPSAWSEARALFVAEHTRRVVFHAVDDAGECAAQATSSIGFLIPGARLLMIAKEEFGRALNKQITFRRALKYFIVRSTAETGLSFVCKKGVLIIGTLFWGATVALILAPIGRFIGSRAGSWLGNFIKRLEYEAAKKSVLAYGALLELEIRNEYRTSRQKVLEAVRSCCERLDELLTRLRRREQRALRRMEAQEKQLIATFLEQWPELLSSLERTQRRVRRHLTRFTAPNLIERMLPSPDVDERTREVRDACMRADERLAASSRTLCEPDAGKRFMAVLEYLTTVHAGSKPVTEAIQPLCARLLALEAARVERLTRLTELDRRFRHKYLERIGQLCEPIQKELTDFIAARIKNADIEIARLIQLGEEIGLRVAVERPWVR